MFSCLYKLSNSLEIWMTSVAMLYKDKNLKNYLEKIQYTVY